VNGVLSVAEDVTDLVAARIEAQERLAALERIDEERRRLLDQLPRVRREERHHLAREIHDDLGQLLTSASLYSATISAQAPQVDDASLTSLRSVINDAMRSARRIVASLRDTGVGGDLAVAVERLVQDAGAADVRIDLQDAGSDRPLPGDVAAAAHRIVQEALTNAVKHAKASTISIVIDQGGDVLTVVIEDDGVGFDDTPGRVAERGGYGLVGMGERAEGVQGTLSIASAVGRGTAVRLEVPLEGRGDG
jgi:signal transduction histidine kinase